MSDTTSKPDDEGRGTVAAAEQAGGTAPERPGSTPSGTNGSNGSGAASASSNGSNGQTAAPQEPATPAGAEPVTAETVEPEPDVAEVPAAATKDAASTDEISTNDLAAADTVVDTKAVDATTVDTTKAGVEPTVPRQSVGGADDPTVQQPLPHGDDAPTMITRTYVGNGEQSGGANGSASPSVPPQAPPPAPGPVPGPGPAAAAPPPWNRVPGQEQRDPEPAVEEPVDEGPTLLLESPTQPASSGESTESGSGWSAVRAVRNRPPRQAALQLKRLDPWSVLKLSLVLAVVLFLIWLVAVGVLYGVLNGMGVWERLNGSYDALTGEGSTTAPLISAGRVFGIAALVGAINSLLFAVAMTISAFVYNVSADLVGGVEVTLSERD